LCVCVEGGAVLGFELRALLFLGGHCTICASPQVLFVLVIFRWVLLL
jgi:hypothetical protein